MSAATLTAAPGLRAQPEPRSDAGRRLAADVERLAPTLAARNRERDRDGRFGHESLADLRELGYLRAAVPEEHGGLGVVTVHDLVVVASRLARADASLAVGVNMHTITAHQTAQAWRVAEAAGNEHRATRLAASLRVLAESGVAIGAAISEPGGGQDLSRPRTRATRVEGGWRVDGTKAFCSMSPGADLLGVGVTFADEHGEERFGFATVATGAPGCTVHDDWDALGLRASGSGRVTLDGVLIDARAVSDSHPAGRTSAEALDRWLTSGLFHASVTLGIAEAAHLTAIRVDGDRRERLAHGRPAELVADDVVDLAAMWGTLGRAADRADEHHLAAQMGEPRSLEVSADAFAQVQAAKALVDRLAPRVVDRSLELSGGAGFLAGHPLAQAYRDVRAGAFMHPLGANRASAFLAAVELGRTPSIA